MFPLLPIEYAGCVAVVVALFLANTAGAAGAGTVIPVAMYFFGFNYKSSIYLSLASITTSSLVRFVQNFNRPHPLKSGTGVLIDYSVPTIMMPTIVIGVSIGVLVNRVMPSIYILIGMILVSIVILAISTAQFFKVRKHDFETYGPMKCCG